LKAVDTVRCYPFNQNGQIRQTGPRVTLLLVGLATPLLLGSCGEASRPSQEQATEGKTFVRLELSPTNYSRVGGAATFAEAAAGTRVKLQIRGLPEPHETYLAHLHPGSCEEENHPDVPEGETADHHGNEHEHREHAEEIDYPLMPITSNIAGEGSSTTVLEGVTLDELFSHGPRYLNIHAAGSGDPPQLACADLGDVR
jgi:Cu/Zn superoxide dismutase